MLTIPAGVARGGLVAAGTATILWTLSMPERPITSEETRNETATIGTVTATVAGNSAAPIVVIEISDFLCRYCAEFTRVAKPELFSKYVDTGRIRWSFLHLPKAGDTSILKAKLAICAGAQGRFWVSHDWLFRTSREDLYDLGRLSAAIGLQARELEDCARRDETRRSLQSQMRTAVDLGVVATPTFLIGEPLPDGRVRIAERIVGSVSASEFGSVLERHLRGR